MIDDSLIHIYLLSPEPIIHLKNDLTEINRTDALNLLIYAADQGKVLYERESFGIAVIGEESKSKRFRDALSILNRIFRDLDVDGKLLYGQKTLEFKQHLVWVDTHEFTQIAKEVLNYSIQDIDFDLIQIMKSALSLYTAHFLQDYTFDSDQLKAWQQKRQTELMTIYHSVLEQLIQFHIYQGALDEAQYYAEAWLESLEALDLPYFLPLEYLIWTGVKRRNYARVQHHLTRLQQQESEPTFFGTNVETWRMLLQKEEDPPLTLLRLTPSPDQPTAVKRLNDNTDSRLTDFVDLLTGTYIPPVIGLLGLPGAGKTVFAKQAVQLLQHQKSDFEVAWIELNINSDFESLLNDVLLQFHLSQLETLQFAVKQTRLRQLSQAHRYLVVIDEGTSQRFLDEEYLEPLCNLFDGMQLILVARKIVGNNYYPFELHGFDVDRIRQFILDEAPDGTHITTNDVEAIRQITYGLPLSLNWLTGFVNDRRFHISTFILALSKLQTNSWTFETATDNYTYILNWLWQQLMVDDKNILFTISMFDPTYGVTFEDIEAISDTAFVLKPERLQEKLDLLLRLKLVEVQTSAKNTPQYSLHPITYTYIQQQTQELSQITTIQQAYIQHIFHYAHTHCSDFTSLDKHKNNIVWMFEIVLLQNSHQYFNLEIIALLNQLFDYFNRCGLHTKMQELFGRALEIDDISGLQRIQLLHHLGQALFKQGKLDNAESWFNQAWDVAQNNEISECYSSILRDLGRVYFYRGEYEKAIRYFEQGKKYTDPNQFIIRGQILANLGSIAERQGRYIDAKRCFEEITEYIKNQPDSIDSSYDYQNLYEFVQATLGLIAIDQKEYVQAKRHLETSLTVAKSMNNPERIAIAYLNLGVVHFYQSDFDIALDYIMQGDIVAQYLHHSDLLIMFLWNKGAIYVVKREYIRAKQLLQRALSKANDLGIKSFIPYVFVWFGILHFCQIQMEPAKQYLILILNETALNPWFTALALYGLGLVTRYEKDIARQDNLATATMQITHTLKSNQIKQKQLGEVSKADLERAQIYYQVALHDIPQLEEFYVVEALETWLQARMQ